MNSSAPAPIPAPSSPSPQALTGGPHERKAKVLLYLKVLALGVVLALHFCTRLSVDAVLERSPSARLFYVEHYGVSLALLAGRGFTYPELDESAAARPLKDFLALRRDSLSAEELEAYDSARFPTVNPGADPTTRVLDLYVAALLWKLFGVSWTVYFAFYALLSTAACYWISRIAAACAGNFWAGLAAALFFTAAPLENFYAIFSVRDVNLVWFASLAFWWLACHTDRFQRPWVNGLSYVGLGVLSMVGLGWRTDALILPPFMLCLALARAFRRGRKWKQLAVAALLFIASAWTVERGILVLGGGTRRPNNVGYHIAYYGNFKRGNIFGWENSFQIPFCDGQTAAAASFFHVQEHPGDPPLVFNSPEYADACKAIYLESMKYHAYNVLAHYPLFYASVFRGFPVNSAVLSKARIITVGKKGERSLRLIDRINRVVVFVGMLVALLLAKDVVLAGGLFLFSLYYGAILLAVLPMGKHAAALLLPQAVLGGLGTWALLSFLRPRIAWTTLREAVRGRWRWILGLGCAAVALWLAATGCAWFYARAERERYLAQVESAATEAQEAPEGILDPQLGMVSLPPHYAGKPAGYLFEIQAGAAPGLLVCHHHRPHYQGNIETFSTWHDLRPNATQHFFVACVTGTFCQVESAYVGTVLLEGDAKLVSCKRLDLSAWKGLPLCTVYWPGQASPGAPFVIKKKDTTNHYKTEGSPLGLLGLDREEGERVLSQQSFFAVRCERGVDRELRLVPRGPAGQGAGPISGGPMDGSAARPQDLWIPDGKQALLMEDGLHVRLEPENLTAGLRSSRLTAAEDGLYIVRLSGKRLKGDLRFTAMRVPGLGGGAPGSAQVSSFSPSPGEWILPVPVAKGEAVVLSLVPRKAGEAMEVAVTGLDFTFLSLPGYLLGTMPRK